MRTLPFSFLISALSFQGIYAQAPVFAIEHQVRNLTKQNLVWTDFVQVQVGDRIEFRTTVIWGGEQSTTDVWMHEILDQGLTYEANLKLDGNPLEGNPTADNVNLGVWESNQSKTVTFEATVSALAGTASLVNTATVFSAQGAASDTARVELAVETASEGEPTEISTGLLNFGMIGFVLAVGAALGGGILLFLRSFLRREVFESPYNTRTERKLAAMIGSIKQRERRS